MAQLKDLLVTGATRILGKVYSPEFVGKLTGNADTASKLTSNAGSNIQPIYFNNGVPVATSYSLNAKVNAGTAARLAYYSTSTNLAAAGRIGYWDSNNSKGATRTYLKIWGPTYGNTASTTISGAAGVLNWDDGGPQIRFGTSETTSQDGALIYTDNDYSGTGASFHFVSTEGDVSVNSKRFVARTSVTIGQNLQNNSYNLYVNGNASIYKDLRIIGNESIDDSTRLIFHASDSTQRAIIAWNGNVDNGSQSSTHLKISSSYGAIKLKPGNGYLDFGNGSNDLHIQAHTKTFNQDIISAYDAPGGGYGIDLVIGAGATTIVGAGESAAAMRSVGASANENLYLTADANVFLYSNCDTIGNRRYVVFDTSRNFYPDTDSSGSIGVSNKRWNNGYFNYLNIRGSSSTDMTYSTTNPKIIFSDENGAQAVGIVYTDTDVYRPTKGLKIMDVNNDDAGNVWFEVQGDIWTGGNIRINNNKGLIQSQSNTSNYTSAVLWYKNGVSQNTYNPQIGQHNTGGDGNGSICILPYATATEPWGGTVGLFITKSILKLDGKRISTTGNDSGTVGGNSRFIYSNAGTLTASTATVGNSTTPVYVNNGTFTAITSYSGNSATATRLQTSRTISLTGTVVGSGSFNGSANLSISTSVKDVNNSNTVTFAYSKAGVGYNDITWLAAWNGYELRAINKNQFAKASTSGNALYADDSDKLDGYHRKGLYPSIPDWINANGYTKTITVNGNANTYYPVVIGAPLNKEGLSYVSIWKNLGSKTASYSGNHSNGTSSMWIIYEGRNWYWDGNGGYAKCWYYSMPYATLCAQTDFLPNNVGSYCVYLRGGGTDYCISTTYDCTPKVYYSATNVGDSNYPVNIAPRTSVGNYGRVSSTVLGYGNIEGIATAATSLTSSAGSSTSPIYFSGGKPVTCSYTLNKSVPSDAKFTDTNTWRPLGKGASDACAGNDSRLSNSRPASDVYAWAKASSKPSYSWGEITGKPSTFTPSSHNHSSLVTVGDNRNSNTTPNSYTSNLIFQGLKTNSKIDSPSNDTFSYVVGLRGWGDNSGGYAHELAFNDSGIFARRGSTTSWNVGWQRVLLNGNTATIPGISLDNNGAYIYGQDNSGNIFFRFRSSSSANYSYTNVSYLYNNKLGAQSANGYWGMATPYGGSGDWIRTTSNGIIPYQSGGAGAGHCGIGTSSWYFSTAYIDTVNCVNTNASGYLQANGLINTFSEYQSQKGNRDWRFGSATGSGDQNWFGWYDYTSGYHGGIYGPSHILRMNGEIQSTSANAFRAIYGNYGFIIRNDGANTYFMMTSSGDPWGSWNDNYTIFTPNGEWQVKKSQYDGGMPTSRGYVVVSDSNADRVYSLSNYNASYLKIRGGLGTYHCTYSNSDIRLKMNVKDSEVNALSTINRIKVRQFNWKKDGKHQKIGFIADELEELDEKFSIGGGYEGKTMDVKSVDTFYLMGYMVKAIQELSEQNLTLKQENDKILKEIELLKSKGENN